jgi:hypothetical protein
MSWSPNDYQFQPYELQAQRLPSGVLPSNSDAGKRKGGRQRRSSILCQVSTALFTCMDLTRYYYYYYSVTILKFYLSKTPTG